MIAKLFQSLLSSLELTYAQSLTFAQHRDTVRTRLESSFNTSSVALIGSYSRGTNVRGRSDVDLLLVLRREEVRWAEDYVSSNTALSRVRQELQDRYSYTAVNRDGEAIVIEFKGGEYSVDVTPAFYWTPGQGNLPVYQIPDGSGWWKPTSPAHHGAYIKHADSQSGGKLRQAARLLKFWRSCLEPVTPISSFHVELLLAQTEICSGAKSYSVCLRDLFIELSRRECRGLQDPCGVSGVVECTSTEAKRIQAWQRVAGAADRAAKAVEAEQRGDLREAFRLWDVIFNGTFPRS